ncbi:unnamed protein product, partial [Protopolystoma xenopodis]
MAENVTYSKSIDDTNMPDFTDLCQVYFEALSSMPCSFRSVRQVDSSLGHRGWKVKRRGLYILGRNNVVEEVNLPSTSSQALSLASDDRELNSW